jgi:hypothetical protein
MRPASIQGVHRELVRNRGRSTGSETEKEGEQSLSDVRTTSDFPTSRRRRKAGDTKEMMTDGLRLNRNWGGVRNEIELYGRQTQNQYRGILYVTYSTARPSVSTLNVVK